MIKRLKMAMFRRNLKSKNFYENVTFESKEVEKAISEWLFNLKEKRKIELPKFTDLFCGWKEIVLPVKIRKDMITFCTVYADIIDAEEKEYYFEADRFGGKSENYSIGRRGNIIDKNIDRQFCYTIENENEIILRESCAGLVNDDDVNEDCGANIIYDTKREIATATIQNKEKIIEIKYHAEDSIMDDDIINYLLSIKEKDFHNNVTPVFNDFGKILTRYDEIVSIEAKVKRRLHAAIYLKDGQITEHIYSDVGEDGELVIHVCELPISKESRG